MLKLSTHIIGSKIISVHAGGVIGHLGNPVINPHNLTIAAWFVHRPNGEEDDLILVQDIRELSRQGCLIDHEEEIAHASELIRLQDLLRIGFLLPGKNVRTESKKRLGKVEEFVVNLDGFSVQKLHVKPPAWKSLNQSALIIDRQQVVEVTDNTIIVKDTSEKIGKPVTQAFPTPTN